MLWFVTTGARNTLRPMMLLHFTDAFLFLCFDEVFLLMDQSSDDQITSDEVENLQREVPLSLIHFFFLNAEKEVPSCFIS